MAELIEPCVVIVTGSGSLAAMAVFERNFRKDMERDEAMQLVSDAVCAGVFNDLGSGSNVDLCVIGRDKVDYIRPAKRANIKAPGYGKYQYAKGTTVVLSETVKRLPVQMVQEMIVATD